nr:MAG TPA: hypothetical protein [Caudoviricetes sp.]
MRHIPYPGYIVLGRVYDVCIMISRLNKNKCVVNHPHQDYCVHSEGVWYILGDVIVNTLILCDIISCYLAST